jgi:hypothetical protein
MYFAKICLMKHTKIMERLDQKAAATPGRGVAEIRS